jgi:Rad3-related DNA helicase
MQLNQVIDLVSHPIHNKGYEQTCKHQLDNEGVLVLKSFLTPAARAAIIDEGHHKQSAAFYTQSGHNVYLTQKDPTFNTLPTPG